MAARAGLTVRAALPLAIAVLLGAALSACDDPLPGFANPPPYDAGVAADDDAG